MQKLPVIATERKKDIIDWRLAVDRSDGRELSTDDLNSRGLFVYMLYCNKPLRSVLQPSPMEVTVLASTHSINVLIINTRTKCNTPLRPIFNNKASMECRRRPCPYDQSSSRICSFPSRAYQVKKTNSQ
jgi:hypothetical protein